MKRRDFLAGLPVVGPALAGVGTGSDPDVPRRLDCRTCPDASYNPLHIFRYGRKLEHAVAYDLDANWVDVLAMSPADEPIITGDEFEYRRLTGGVVVRWDQEEIRKRKERRRALHGPRHPTT